GPGRRDREPRRDRLRNRRAEAPAAAREGDMDWHPRWRGRRRLRGRGEWARRGGGLNQRLLGGQGELGRGLEGPSACSAAHHLTWEVIWDMQLSLTVGARHVHRFTTFPGLSRGQTVPAQSATNDVRGDTGGRVTPWTSVPGAPRPEREGGGEESSYPFRCTR